MGSSSVTNEQTFLFCDNMSFDGTPRGGGFDTDGQLFIGSTAADRPKNSGHVRKGSLTSLDSSITIGYSAPNITLAVANGVSTWNDVSGAFSPLKNNGYFITGTATGTLPASPSQGDTIKFFVDHASQVLTIQASGTQIIRLGNTVSSAGGTALSTDQGDSLELTYRASSDCWCTIAGANGNWTLN